MMAGEPEAGNIPQAPATTTYRKTSRGLGVAVSIHTTRPGIPVQSPPGGTCRHSRAPFDQSFHVVSRRADISSDAKVVHAYLVSLHRTGRDVTQREMAAAVGLTRHRVWSALQELSRADLVQAIRYGLGRPNGYILLGLDQADLAGKAHPETGARPVRNTPPGQSGTPTRARVPEPKRSETGRTTYQPLRSGQCMGCRGDHPTPRCPRYGYIYRT